MQPSLAIGFILLLSACATPPAALRADTLAYLQKVSAWSATEAETARTLERILATEFVDQAEVLRQIRDSTPRVEQQWEEAKRYEPRTREVRRIHDAYTAAWRTLLDGYDAIKTGLETGDQTKLARGREAMARWRDAILGVAHDLRDLRDRTGIDPGEATPS